MDIYTRTKAMIDIFMEEIIPLSMHKGIGYNYNTDTLQNLKVDGCSGITTRLGDKIARLRSYHEQDTIARVVTMIKTNMSSDNKILMKEFLDNLPNVNLPDESFEDTCRDIAVYAILSLLLFRINNNLPLFKESPHWQAFADKDLTFLSKYVSEKSARLQNMRPIKKRPKKAKPVSNVEIEKQISVEDTASEN